MNSNQTSIMQALDTALLKLPTTAPSREELSARPPSIVQTLSDHNHAIAEALLVIAETDPDSGSIIFLSDKFRAIGHAITEGISATV